MKKTLILVLSLISLMILPARAEEVNFTLSFAGDCTLGSEEYLHKRDTSFVAFIEKYGMDYPFEKVRDLFLKDDWTLVNLECVLADSSKGENKKETYRFRGPTSFTGILKAGGVEMVNLGNNHTDDYGKVGLQSTMEALKTAEIPYSYQDDIYILEKGGIKIAFLGLTITAYSGHGEALNKRIASLKKDEGCQFVVVSLHFGQEYSLSHNRSQSYTAHQVITSGADLVIGTHPHCLQGIEIFKNRLVLYSLGNFSFGGNGKIKDRGLEAYIAQVKVTFKDGVFSSQQLNIIPVHTSSIPPLNNYQPYLVKGKEAQAIVDQMQKDTPFPLNPYREGIGAMQVPVPAK